MIKVLIGVDFGTTKTIATIRYTDNEEEIAGEEKVLKIGNLYEQYAISSNVFIKSPKDFVLEIGKLEDEVSPGEKEKLLFSIKRCLFCELAYGKSPIREDDCLNHKNYNNPLWCDNGRRDFEIEHNEFNPSFLYTRFMYEVFKRTKSELNNEPFLRDIQWELSEIKVTFPVLLHRVGPKLGGIIENQIKSTIREIFGVGKAKQINLTVVEEPTAALLEHYKEINKMPLGYGMVVDIGGGTTDLLLFKRFGNRARIYGKTSFPKGGDDYDDIVKKLMVSKLTEEKIDIKKINPLKLNKNSREIKEEKESGMWDKTFTIEVNGKLKGPFQINEEVLNMKFNNKSEEIITKIRDFLIDLDPNLPKELKTILLTGGGNNIIMLKRKIEELFKNAKIEEVEFESSSLPFFEDDSKLIATGLGASIPYHIYINFLEHTLPINMILTIDSDLNKSILLYSAGTKAEHEEVKRINISWNKLKIYLHAENPKNLERICLQSKSFSAEKHKKYKKLIIKYAIDYKGRMRVDLEFGGKVKKIYDGYPTKKAGFF